MQQFFVGIAFEAATFETRCDLCQSGVAHFTKRGLGIGCVAKHVREQAFEQLLEHGQTGKASIPTANIQVRRDGELYAKIDEDRSPLRSRAGHADRERGGMRWRVIIDVPQDRAPCFFSVGTGAQKVLVGRANQIAVATLSARRSSLNQACISLTPPGVEAFRRRLTRT